MRAAARRLRALADPVLDHLSSLSLYTYFAVGYVVSQCDYITQVLFFLGFSFYTAVKRDETAVSNYARFLAGYLAGALPGSIY